MMTTAERYDEFLRSLWSGEEENLVSDNDMELLESTWEIMSRLDGKTPLEFVERIYDTMMATPGMAVRCHRMGSMRSRIVASTAWVCDRIGDGEQVLDLGTNTGHQVLFWAGERPDARFTGIDISTNAILIAEKWRERLSVENVAFHRGNFEDRVDSIGPSSIDTLVSCFTIETVHEYFRDDCPIPSWIVEAMKPGGRLLACMTVASWPLVARSIEKWRTYGFALSEFDVVPTGNGYVMPVIEMTMGGEDNGMTPGQIEYWCKKMYARVWAEDSLYGLEEGVYPAPEIQEPDPDCDYCDQGFGEIVLQAGPFPDVTPPLDCPKCNGGCWEVWDMVMPGGWREEMDMDGN